MHLISRIIRSLLLHLIVPGIFLAGGWYGGAKYGAPDLLIRAVDGVVARGKIILSPLIADGVDRSGELAASAVEQGSEYVVGTVEQVLEDLAEEPEETTDEAGEESAEGEEGSAGDASASESAGGAVSGATVSNEGDIVICQMRISNAPRGGQPAGSIGRADETTTYKGVNLLLMPATKACLSSGYGSRGGRTHRGVDYYSDQGGDVLAAGDGVIVEAVSRSDYGNMIVIDHGNGVYTRYAHLARFGSGVREGASVSQGQVLGPIGKSGASSIVHLHYEVLTGDFNTQAKSFGLESKDPYRL